MKKAFVGIVALLGVCVATGFILLDKIADHLIREKLPSVEMRIGQSIDYETVNIVDFKTVILNSVILGDVHSTVLRIERIEVDLDDGFYSQFKAVPKEVRIYKPDVQLKTDGSFRGIAKALRDLIPKRGSKAASDTSTGTESRKLPSLIVVDGSFEDSSKRIQIQSATGTFEGLKFTGSFVFARPDQGQCILMGDLSEVHLKCDRPYRHPISMGFQVQVPEVKVRLKPVIELQLRGLELSRDESLSDVFSLLAGLKADFDLEWSESANQLPIAVALQFPWGGRVSGTGHLGLGRDRFQPRTLNFAANVSELPLARFSSHIQSGRLSGQYQVNVDLLERILNIKADGRLDEFWLFHKALSEKPVGGVPLSFSGQLDAEIGQLKKPGFGLRLSNAFFKIGQLMTNVKAEIGSVDGSLETTKLQLALESPMVQAAVLNDALPKGLLPRLEPIKATGMLGLKAGLFIDFSNFDATRLKIEMPRKRFRIKTINPEIRRKLRSLRSSFKLEHTLTTKTGTEVKQTRRVGPNTANWVNIENVPSVLPEAIRIQEDGGFFGHKGISEYHIRGSLISNLKAGRFRRGGSTITMQLARNLFLTKSKTLSRKIQEIIMAYMLDGDGVYCTKFQILELYINIVELGPDIYGIKEAAKHYFDKDPAALSPVEIAWIVRLLPGPRLYYRSFRRGQLSHSRVKKINSLLARLVKKDLIAPEQGMPIGVKTLWPNGNQGRAKSTIDGIPSWSVRKAEKAQREQAKEDDLTP
ncbi:MAG: biosynthetic peptidoglycan transglycosylase [Myxococcota bacterium]|nr:biosynthetic peptidoglycan transglycosylase [Myxococcota bacterium]